MLLLATICISNVSFTQNNIVVFQTDFGLKDGAVAAMKGVAMQVDEELKLYDITHEIPAYNIWEAAYRLDQTAKYWPSGTVFVSVVDPGVGSERKAVVLQTNSGYYFVSPDNGTLTLVAKQMGIRAVREIDTKTNRLPGSDASYTFHGRDIFAYTAARLASGKISFDQVGKLMPPAVIMLPFQEPVFENNTIKGTISLLDIQYGNVWTNIDEGLLQQAKIKINDMITVYIYHNDSLVYSGNMSYVNTFNAVAEGSNLCYLNSMLQFSIAMNMGNFAAKHNIASGPDWKVKISRH